MEFPPRQVGNYQAQDGVNNGPIANHQAGRGSTGTSRMFSQKLQQDVCPETVLKMNLGRGADPWALQVPLLYKLHD